MAAEEQEEEWPVELWVYDLSHGLARQLSAQLLGTTIDAIYHTSCVVHGQEHFFGAGISITRPGHSHHGQPQEKLDMGKTTIDGETWREILADLRERYTAERYHLLDYNCNTFSAECVEILTGGSIPDRIKNLPAEFLNTPFGAMMRPSIDAMFRGQGAAPGPSAFGGQRAVPANASPGAAALLNGIAREAYLGNEDEAKSAPPTAQANGSAHQPAKHPHDALEPLTSTSEPAWSATSTWQQKLNWRTVGTRIESALSNCPSASSFQAKASLQDIGRIFRTKVLPPLELGQQPSAEVVQAYQGAMERVCALLPAGALFPFVELGRELAYMDVSPAATGKARQQSWWQWYRSFARSLESSVNKEESNEGAAAKVPKVLLSAYRLLANTIQHVPAQASAALSEQLNWIISGLLHSDVGVRAAAASAARNLLRFESDAWLSGKASRNLNDDALNELFTALLESLKLSGAEAPAETTTVEPLQIALLRAMWKSPSWEGGMGDLVSVLEAKEIVLQSAESRSRADLVRICDFAEQ